MSDGKVTIDTRLDSKGIAQGFTSLKGAVSTMAKGAVVGLGAVAVGAGLAGKALWDSANAIAENGDEIDKASQKLGIGAEAYQKLSYACELSGTSIDNIKLGVKNITNDLADMANGVDGASDKYDRLGVSLIDANGNLKSNEDVLKETLLALADMEDETQRNALANDIFGRSYQELMPLLNSGADGIQAMMDEAEAYGMVMGNDAVKASAKFEDSLTKLKGSANGLKNSLLADVLPAFTEIIDGFSDLVAGNEGASDKLAKGFINLGNTIVSIVQSILKALPTIVSTVIQVIIGAINSVGDIVPQFVSLFVELVPQIVKSISEGLPLIAEAGISMFMSLINSYKTLAPTFRENGTTIIATIVKGIMKASTVLMSGLASVITQAVEYLPVLMPMMTEAMVELMNNAVDVMLENAPALLDASILLFTTLIDAIPIVLPLLIQAIPMLINAYVTALTREAPVFLKGAVKLFSELTKAILIVLPTLIKMIPQIVDAIISVLEENFPLIEECAVDMLNIIVDYIPEFVKILAKEVPKIVVAYMNNFIPLSKKIATLLTNILSYMIQWDKDVITKFKECAKQIVDKFVEKLSELKDKVKSKLEAVIDKIVSFSISAGQNALNAGRNIFNNVVEGVKNLPSRVREIGQNIVIGMWNGINDKFNWLTTQIKSFATKVTDKLKDFFKIKSPSRVMRDEVGKYLAEGIGVGFEENNPIDEIKANLKNSMSNLQASIGLDANNNLADVLSRNATVLNFYDTQTSPDAIYQKFYQQQTFGLAREF